MKLLAQLNYVDVVARRGSIRKAADVLNITSTALNRRILALEEELGTAIFERLPQGVRLNVAGELLIQHIRKSMSDLSRVHSQIADLSGVRSGHVAIASGAETVGRFLPQQIANYRQNYPDVTFNILRRAPHNALRALDEFEADVAVIFETMPPPDYQVLLSVDLRVMVAMAKSHPLAEKPIVSFVDCLDYPAVLPAEGTGLHDLILTSQQRKGVNFRSVITSDSHDFMAHYSAFENAITFLLSFGDDGLAHHVSELSYRPLRAADKISGRLHITQAKGRVLPVAAAKFVEDMIQYLSRTFPEAAR